MISCAFLLAAIIAVSEAALSVFTSAAAFVAALPPGSTVNTEDFETFTTGARFFHWHPANFR